MLSGSFIIYNLQFEESNFWFDIYSFTSLLLFNKNNTWRPTCFIIQTTDFNHETGEISLFIKALRLRQLRQLRDFELQCWGIAIRLI